MAKQETIAETLSPEAQAFEVNREADESKRQREALEVVAKHRDAIGADAPDPESAGTLANHRRQLATLGKEVNEATNALLQFGEPGESLNDIAERGKRSNVNPAFAKAAHRAIQAHTEMDTQQQAANQAQADINAEQDANEFSEMKNLRKQELRNAARKIAAEENIPLADAFSIALMEIQVDGVETVLPAFAKVTKRKAAQYAAEEGDS